jgi:phosphate transport system substrate-binding protein
MNAGWIRWISALAVVTGACGKSDVKTVTGDGSSTVFLISEAVAEGFRGVMPEVRVTVGVSGTGGGFKKFCAGETDFQNASRPIKPTEVELCAKAGIEYVELPIAYDGIAIVVNPKNDWAQDITRDELKKLWAPEAQQKVMRWSDVRQGWPDRPIALFGAGVDSGTYDYFTEAIVGKEHSSRGDFTSSEDDNVIVRGVSADPGALGFFGFAYFEENQDKLRALPVDGGKGPVAPSVATIGDSSYFPLSRPLFLYVSKKAMDRPEMQAFMSFYLKQASAFSLEVGYIPLPDEAYGLAQSRLDKRTHGSLFGGKGSQVGVSIRDLLAREAAP